MLLDVQARGNGVIPLVHEVFPFYWLDLYVRIGRVDI